MTYTPTSMFVFWTSAPGPLGALIRRVTKGSWTHCGIGFSFALSDISHPISDIPASQPLLSPCSSGAQPPENIPPIYFEALYRSGFSGPKPVAKLRKWANADNATRRLRIHRIPSDLIGPEAAAMKYQECLSLVGHTGYYALQLVAMWGLERFGIPVRSTQGRVVCSEIMARIAYPELDLRDSAHTNFDAVNPNSAYRQYIRILISNSRTGVPCGRPVSPSFLAPSQISHTGTPRACPSLAPSSPCP